jgi:aspartyl-tRNA(Asn)/glutamyl-tRNA(Gln) amidotransferase subunit A
MTFHDWQQLRPEQAAREIHARVQRQLSPAQRRAAIAQLGSETEIATRFAAAPRGRPLSGVPYFTKDLFDAAGLPTFAGSTFLPEVRPVSRDGALTRALASDGAVLVGKSQMNEFAYGITGENSHFGDCERPGFPGRVSGGSSSGSAALVASGIVPLATASDTGGSVRLPAAFCGLFGFRDRPKEPWIADAFPLAPSFDTAGWFTAGAVDMRLALSALFGLRGSERAPRGCYLEMPGVDRDVADAVRADATRLASQADAATSADLRHGFASAAETYNAIAIREAWSVHERWAERFRERYDPAVWQRLVRVRALTPQQMESAEANAAAMRLLWSKFFLTFDFLVLAASPCVALTKAECTLENRNRILALTAPASIGGLPVLTLPVTLSSRLTTGLQVIVNSPQSPVLNWALEKWQQESPRRPIH